MKQMAKRGMAIFLALVLTIAFMPQKINLQAAYSVDKDVTITISFRNDTQNNKNNAKLGKVFYKIGEGAFQEIAEPTQLVDNAYQRSVTVSIPNGSSLYVKIVPNENYDMDWTAITYQEDSGQEVQLNAGEESVRQMQTALTGNGLEVTDDVTAVSIRNIEFSDNPPGPGQGDPQAGGNTHAQINLTGPDGSWTVNPMVRDNYDVVDWDTGISSCSYSKYAYVVSVGINGGSRTRCMNQYDKNKENYDEYKTQTVDYNRESTETTVSIDFFTNWGNKITKIKINNQNYPVPLDYTERYDWLQCFTSQGILFTVDDVDVSTNKKDDGTEIYDIEVEVCPITEEECYIGNFLWSNDDYFSNEDLYIGHSKLELISVTFDDGTGEQTKKMSELKNAQGQNVYEYVHVSEGTDFETGARRSSMVIPEGAWVTMRIEPEYGYQVKSFDLSGSDVRTGEDLQSVFSFKIGKGNFHIGAHVEKQENDAKISADKVDGAGIDLAEGTLESGSARLYVDDVEVSEGKETAFAEAAAEMDCEIDSIVNISLDQVFFKGTGNDDDVWANEMEDLEKDATIRLKLDGYNGEPISLVHNIHDGEEFEEILMTYDAVDGTYVGMVNSFSNFAIAKKSTEEVALTTDDGNKIEFTGTEGHEYEFICNDLTNPSAEVIERLGLESAEIWQETVKQIASDLEEKGTFVGIFNFDLRDVTTDTEVTTGPFEVKILLTDEMKAAIADFNTFYFVSVDYDPVEDRFVYDGKVEAKIVGDYLVATFEHFSIWSLVGNKKQVGAKTSDVPLTGIPFALLCGMATLGFGFYSRRRRQS